MTQPMYERQYEEPTYSTGGRPTGARREAETSIGAEGEMDFESALTSDMRLSLHDFVQAATVCEWCADRCLDHGPEMRECVRLCRDVASLASLNVAFLARDSPFGLAVAETFARAAAECADECARHPHAHCQECARVLDRAIDSTWRLIDAFEHERPYYG